MFLAGHPNHQLVFMRIWQIEPAYLTNAFRDFYDESNLNITRILDVAQDLKVCVPNQSSLTLISNLVVDLGCVIRSPPLQVCVGCCCPSFAP